MIPAWLSPALLGRALRFGILGSVSVAIFYWGMPLLIEDYAMPSALAGLVLALSTNIINYFGNYFFAFRSRKPHAIALRRYATVITFNLGLNALGTWLMLDRLHWSYGWVTAVLACTIPALSFVLYNWWAFGDGT